MSRDLCFASHAGAARTVMACVPLLPAALLVGCVADGNTRSTLGGGTSEVALPAFAMAGDDRAARPAYADGPSLRATAGYGLPASSADAGASGLDRSGWRASTVVVPVDGVMGHPRYLRNYTLSDELARQRGDFPTALSATELPSNDQASQRGEAVLAPLVATGQALLLVPRMIFVQPWEQVRHTPQPLWRAPVQTRRQVPGAQTPEAHTP